MNGKIAVLATTSILTFGIAIPAYAENDNLPAGSFQLAADATAPKTADSDPTMSDDVDMETDAVRKNLRPNIYGDDDAAKSGKTMESDPK